MHDSTIIVCLRDRLERLMTPWHPIVSIVSVAIISSQTKEVIDHDCSVWKAVLMEEYQLCLNLDSMQLLPTVREE